ncbi:MAG: OsmC family peroxiredoxin [Candidatus Eremiobacteraeota bacterium]|nr:OsmC family peroxiredoxin [Candidatus Eremiobacteraeota bacterium]
MPERTAVAHWDGDLRTGAGRVELSSGAFKGAYSYNSRFENGAGTNPEELIAAAHAACFSMATSGGLTKAGFKPVRINTTARVHLESIAGGFKVQRIDLDMDAEVPGIDEAAFSAIAQAAKAGCPISQALAAVPEIVLHARLRQTTA